MTKKLLLPIFVSLCLGFSPIGAAFSDEGFEVQYAEKILNEQNFDLEKLWLACGENAKRKLEGSVTIFHSSGYGFESDAPLLFLDMQQFLRVDHQLNTVEAISYSGLGNFIQQHANFLLVLPFFSNLRYLDLHCIRNNTLSQDSLFTLLTKAFDSLTKLEYLKFSCCQIGRLSVDQLRCAFSKLPNLKVLQLAYSDLNKETALALLEVLPNLEVFYWEYDEYMLHDENNMHLFKNKFSNRYIFIKISGVDINITVDSSILISAIHNIFHNAYKYSNNYTIFDIKIKDLDKYAEIHFINYGIQIKNEELLKIFEIYY